MHPFRKRGAFRKVKTFNYFLTALPEVVGADALLPMVELVAMLPGLPVVLPIVEFAGGGIVLVVITGAGVLAGVDGLTLALLAGVSPQAIPNAPMTRTAESAITFFICFTNSYRSQRLNLVSLALADQTQPFASNSFFFEAIVNIVFEKAIVNPKMRKISLFVNIISRVF